MKLKPLYIYLIAGIVVFGAIVMFSSLGEEESVAEKNAQGNIPNDDVHSGLNMGGEDQPTSENVRGDIKQKMDDLKEYVEANPTDTVKLREYADMLSSSHKIDEAIALYDKILTVDKERIDILQTLGFIYFQSRNFEKAIEVTNKILNIDADNVEARYNLGAISITNGDTLTAVNTWKEIIEKYPEDAAADYAKSSLKRLGME